MTAPDMQRVTIDGVELAYRDQGSGEPVLLIHGGIVADAFAPVAREPVLATRYRLVRYHRRGYGQSVRAEGSVGIPRQAADCLGLMRRLGIERAHIVGYSFGGAIALQLPRDASKVVHSLVLLEPTIPAALTDPTTLEYFLGTIGAAAERYGAGDQAGAIDTFARGSFGPDYRASLEQAVPGGFALAVTDADAFFQADAPAIQHWSFNAEDAGRITPPVLSLYHNDPLWAGFRHTHELLRTWFPRLETVILPGSSHLLQMSRPRATAAALAGFFARYPLPGA